MSINRLVEQVMGANEVPMMQRLEFLEKEMLKQPQKETPVRNFQGDNVYAREIIMPAGTFAIGSLHKYDHVSIMIEGKLLYWTEELGVQIMEGYNISIAKAGTKRVGYVLEDVKWIASHYVPGDKNESEAREYLTAVSYEEYLLFKEENAGVIESTAHLEISEAGNPETGRLPAPPRAV